MRGLIVAALGIVLAVGACAMGSPYYTAEPFSAQVVDAETGKPIEGAIVVANWELVRGGLDGAHHVGQLEVKEAVTDANGRFAFEGFTRLNPTLAELRNADPRVLVFKGGYDAQVYYSTILEPQDYPGPRRKAAVDGQVLKLSKLTPTRTGPKLELLKFHGLLNNAVYQIVGDCEWQKMSKLLRAMDEEKNRLRLSYPNALMDIGIEDLADQSDAHCKLTRGKL